MNRKFKIEFIFAWYDMWIGMYWDRDRRWLYVLPFFCIGFVIKFDNKLDLSVFNWANILKERNNRYWMKRAEIVNDAYTEVLGRPPMQSDIKRMERYIHLGDAGDETLYLDGKAVAKVRATIEVDNQYYELIET